MFPPWLVSSYQCEVTECGVEKRGAQLTHSQYKPAVAHHCDPCIPLLRDPDSEHCKYCYLREQGHKEKLTEVSRWSLPVMIVWHLGVIALQYWPPNSWLSFLLEVGGLCLFSLNSHGLLFLSNRTWQKYCCARVGTGNSCGKIQDQMVRSQLLLLPISWDACF